MKDKSGWGPLLAEASQGNQEAFAQLITAHKQCMYATALAVTKHEQDALDAIQDTVLLVWQKLPTLEQPAYFKTWLTKVLVNQCCSLLRKRRRELPVESLEAQGEGKEEGRALDESMDVEAALGDLGENDQLLLQLFYFEDFSIKQIGEILSVAPNTIKMRLTRSRRRFLEAYQARNQEVCYEKQ